MAGLVIFAAAFCVYATTAAPAMGWLDSPEFVASASSLGIAHSPGHPLPALLGRLATLLPVGDLSFRVNVMSAVAGAGATLALQVAARHLLAIAVPELTRSARRAAATGAALVFTFSHAAWLQAVRAEVYSLQALLVIATLAAILAHERHRQARWLALAGLLAGLALANHHLIAILFLAPAAIAVLATRRRPTLPVATATMLLGILGLAALLYLPIRATTHPQVNWGAPDTAERFAWTVSAKAFQKSVATERPSSTGEDAANALSAVLDSATSALVLAALIGLYLALRRRGWRRLALLFAAIVATSLGGRILIGFDPEMPDHHAYLIPAIAVLILLGVVGALRLVLALLVADATARSRASWAVIALLPLLVVMQLWGNRALASMRSAYAADELARWELEPLPPRAVLLTSHFETSYRLWALRTTEQSRPDVIVLDLGFLTYPGTAGESKRRHPELTAVIDAPLSLTAPLPIAALQELAPRPVMIQLQPALDRRAYPLLLPSGAYALLAGAPPSPALRSTSEAAAQSARRHLGQRLASPGPSDRIGVRNALLWHDFNQLRFYCLTGRPTTWKLAEDSLLEPDCRLTLLPDDARGQPGRDAGAERR